ncbi:MULTISPECIES: MPT63 family protein [unclassified Mycolicibacterium]|uniref:MPT63 family protein n=1 Tax=unclassified Mycolicibacterium TaxID=2636767 RepID=UPI0012DC0678|nr:MULTISPECIES: MPT63 family protein [unclassified Mycolicibacterium]MUL83062.1 DUF1942 domain-containing protein [Mycolicibacterium sp. CBMA 329]MUL89397.1 DUF1942 domain-containing protein [Mycolicibacterium sp. CBMA 331]MUL99086.1 DUF1942 domain-containing protein [Mycolicibacterium sp. CBMA 334]MUM24712.1 DUF1942 domain-containing protein [Mycolicibacterium sp. CBMA 295]MUM38913.1 DUF1942 domain-containing protein [Mycolicibacterium sp. CBMA 247]
MKIAIKTATAAVAAAGFAALGIACPTASASGGYPHIQKFGTPEDLVDGAGSIVQTWTVRDLRPSTDAIGWPVHGQLWQADATVKATRGTVTPIVSDMNARAANGQTYQDLALVASPRTVRAATIAQGNQSAGKLYFDVVGPPPDGVVYNAGGRDLLMWVR